MISPEVLSFAHARENLNNKVYVNVMSDILKNLDNSVKQKIYLSTQHCITSSKKAFVNENAIAVITTVPYEHLKISIILSTT